jgi:hypothetical protein
MANNREVSTDSGRRSPGLSFSVAGIPVSMPWSGLLGIGVVAYFWSDAFRIDPSDDTQTWVLALVFALLFYVSILIHELAHAFVARLAGFPVRDITLWVLGGYTAYERKYPSAWREGLIAAAGPGITIVLGLVCRMIAELPAVTDDRVYVLLRALAISNIWLGIFNALPGLPLDGGAVLRALVWGVTGSETRGTVIAAWAGRLIAVGVFALPIYLSWSSSGSLDFGSIVFSALIAAYLFQGASASLARAKLSSRLPSLNAADFVKPMIRVEAATPLSEALRLQAEANAQAIVVVDGYGRPSGVVQDHAVAAVPNERRPWVPASSVALSVSDEATISVALQGEALISRLSDSTASEHVVVDDSGEIVGVLSTSDVEHALAHG